MRIGLTHGRSVANSLGGCEFSIAVLAEALEPRHDVEIITNNTRFTADGVERAFNITLRRTTFRPFPDVPVRALTPWGRFRQYAEREAPVSAGYDGFVCFTHEIPPICRAKSGVLQVLFPLVDRKTLWPWNESDAAGEPWRPSWFRALRKKYYDRLWERRFASYGHVTSNSAYTRGWTDRLWQVDTDIVYPPVVLSRPPALAEKGPSIVSVGRFTPVKRQAELVRAYGRAVGAGLEGWSYRCVGSTERAGAAHRYLAAVRSDAARLGVDLREDAAHDELEDLYEESSIFWHGMGYGEDPERDPLNFEHFGIVTVEAMSRGCVPIVFKGGGQPEIVRHGVDGFVWETEDELVGYTLQLARDPELRERMARSAIARSRRFAKDRFVAEMAARLRLEVPASASQAAPSIVSSILPALV